MFSSTKVFRRLEVTAHQQTLWPRRGKHISVSTAPCQLLTPDSQYPLHSCHTDHSLCPEVQCSQRRLCKVLRNQEARMSPPHSQVRSNLWGQLWWGCHAKKPAHPTAAWYSPKEAGQDSSEEARPPGADGKWHQAAPRHGGFGTQSLRVYSLVKGLSGAPTTNPCYSASWSLVQC